MSLVPALRLPRDFYDLPPQQVARALLGQLLVHSMDGERLSAYILETEAYDGEQDDACHARRGKTPRVEPMYAEAGHAYIYFTYGLHWLLNCVTGPAGYPAAVLVRAVLPAEGLETIAANRAGQKPALWCNGPAKLTRALGITGELNTIDLCSPASELVILPGCSVPENAVQTSPRVGIDYAAEPWRSLPWRFFVSESDFRAHCLKGE